MYSGVFLYCELLLLKLVFHVTIICIWKTANSGQFIQFANYKFIKLMDGFVDAFHFNALKFITFSDSQLNFIFFGGTLAVLLAINVHCTRTPANETINFYHMTKL